MLNTLTIGYSTVKDRLMIAKSVSASLPRNDTKSIFMLYGVRALAVMGVAGIWVVLTLTTGIFTVAMVIPLGIAIGISHRLMKRRVRICHLPSALFLTLTGGIVCNTLAGLAFFSYKMGVNYWNVLLGRRIPEDLPMLAETFARSFEPQDFVFYSLSLGAVVFFALWDYSQSKNVGNLIEIVLRSGKSYLVGSATLEDFLCLNKVEKFKRREGWAVVGKNQLRSRSTTVNYIGTERRNSSPSK